MTTDAVLYTTRWSINTRRPTPDTRWLTEDEARAIYEGGPGESLVVVDAQELDEAGLPHARWTMGIIPSGGIRIRFLTPAGSIWQSTDYDVIDGRLWRWISRNYTYPDDTRRHPQYECTILVTSTFKPDGTGYVDFDTTGNPDIERATLTDASVTGFWLDYPTFGDWHHLTNPDYGYGYGYPPDPTTLRP